MPNQIPSLPSWVDAALLSNPVTAPLGVASAAARRFGQSQPKPPSPAEKMGIGTPVDAGALGTKYYVGSRFTPQTVDTILTLSPDRVSSDPTERANFRLLQQRLAAQRQSERPDTIPPAPTLPPPGNIPPASPDPTRAETETPSGIPGQPPTKQTPDDALARFEARLDRELDPERVAERYRVGTENYIRRALIDNLLSMEKTRENTARQLELKRIEQIEATRRALIEANSRRAMAFQSTVAASLIPNQGLAQVLNQAYANAMQPYGSYTPGKA